MRTSQPGAARTHRREDGVILGRELIGTPGNRRGSAGREPQDGGAAARPREQRRVEGPQLDGLGHGGLDVMPGDPLPLRSRGRSHGAQKQSAGGD